MGATCPAPTLGKGSYYLRSSAGFHLPLHRGAAADRPATFPQAGATTRGLVVATAGGAVVRRGAAKAWRAANAADGAPAFTFIQTDAEAGHPAAVIVFQAAPNAAAIFFEHPHVEGGIAVELEVQGAP